MRYLGGGGLIKLKLKTYQNTCSSDIGGIAPTLGLQCKSKVNTKHQRAIGCCYVCISMSECLYAGTSQIQNTPRLAHPWSKCCAHPVKLHHPSSHPCALLFFLIDSNHPSWLERTLEMESFDDSQLPRRLYRNPFAQKLDTIYSPDRLISEEKVIVKK